jgi:hypothetical protein
VPRPRRPHRGRVHQARRPGGALAWRGPGAWRGAKCVHRGGLVGRVRGTVGQRGAQREQRIKAVGGLRPSCFRVAHRPESTSGVDIRTIPVRWVGGQSGRRGILSKSIWRGNFVPVTREATNDAVSIGDSVAENLVHSGNAQRALYGRPLLHPASAQGLVTALDHATAVCRSIGA